MSVRFICRIGGDYYDLKSWNHVMKTDVAQIQNYTYYSLYANCMITSTCCFLAMPCFYM